MAGCPGPGISRIRVSEPGLRWAWESQLTSLTLWFLFWQLGQQGPARLTCSES